LLRHRRAKLCFLNTPLASALGADDRVKSELFHGQRNGDHGYRRCSNIAGFSWIREQADFPSGGGTIGGLAGDRRLVGIALRQIKNASKVADQLGIPKVMDFHSLVDPETELPLTGVAWQEAGTGDAYVSVALLLGVHIGNGGGAIGGMTDPAGCLIRTE
jgi:hypothetical protein